MKKCVTNATISTLAVVAVAMLYCYLVMKIDNVNGDLGFALSLIAPAVICMIRGAKEGFGLIARPIAWCALVFVFIGGGYQLLECKGIKLNDLASVAWLAGSYWLAFFICEAGLNARVRYVEVE